MKKALITLAVAAAATFAVTTTEKAQAGSVDLNIQLGAYIPAPPGVRIYVEAGRPYYVENHRRVYMKKKHHEDRGKHRGHDKGEDRGKGHGKKHGRD
uniref:Uncharacterized protein n=1 Tax=Geobacter sp. (strain M21) TaxID=443144 RepID=C6E4Z6_GEOSM